MIDSYELEERRKIGLNPKLNISNGTLTKYSKLVSMHRMDVTI